MVKSFLEPTNGDESSADIRLLSDCWSPPVGLLALTTRCPTRPKPTRTISRRVHIDVTGHAQCSDSSSDRHQRSYPAVLEIKKMKFCITVNKQIFIVASGCQNYHEVMREAVRRSEQLHREGIAFGRRMNGSISSGPLFVSTGSCIILLRAKNHLK